MVKARRQAVSFSGNIEDRAKVENALSQTLRSLFAVAEAYPDLKANQNFMSLQEELAGTENKIGFSRQYSITMRSCATKTRWKCFPETWWQASSASCRNLSSNWRKRPTAPFPR